MPGQKTTVLPPGSHGFDWLGSSTAKPEPWPCTGQWNSESSLPRLGGPPEVPRFSGTPAAFLFSPVFLSPDVITALLSKVLGTPEPQPCLWQSLFPSCCWKEVLSQHRATHIPALGLPSCPAPPPCPPPALSGVSPGTFFSSDTNSSSSSF